MAAMSRAVAGPGTEHSSHIRHLTTGEELRGAAQIQHQLLPPPLYTGPYVDVAARAHPCQIIGGDFFDYQDTGHQFRLVLGDVCGHGVAAALQAAVVQGILAVEAHVDDGAASIMTHLNRALCRRAISARFVTLFVGIVTPDDRLTYCNAAQCCPILGEPGFCSEPLRRRVPARPLPRRNLRGGVADDGDRRHTGRVQRRGHGSAGEVRESGEQFGDARILEAVREHPGATASTVLDHLLAKLRDFSRQGQQHDDVTALVMRYLGGGGSV